MAITYIQARDGASDPLTRGVIDSLVQASNVFDRISMQPIKGDSYSYDINGALPGTGFRTVNEAWVESTGTVNQATERLAILGGDSDADKYLVQTSAETRGDLRKQMLDQKIKSIHTTFVDAMFNGDVNVDPKGFDGLRKRLVNQQVVDATARLNTDGAFDDLDDLFARVDGGAPDVVYAPAAVIAKYKSLARKLGGAEYIVSEITGKREWTWNGVPFVDPGEHWSTRRILEAQPGGHELFAVKFARNFNEQGVLSVSNGGLQAYDLGELHEKPAYRVRVEFYAGMAVQGGKAAARLRGLQLS